MIGVVVQNINLVESNFVGLSFQPNGFLKKKSRLLGGFLVE